MCIVDFFTARASARLRDALDAVAFAVFTVIVAVLTGRMIDGALPSTTASASACSCGSRSGGATRGAAVADGCGAVCAWTAWERLAAFVSARKAA